MNKKIFENARFCPKGDIEANWKKAVGFVPLDKEIIIYKPDDTHSAARFKVGDGKTGVNELPFVTEIEGIASEDWVQEKLDEAGSIVQQYVDNAVAAIPSQIQVDWSQNDEIAKDYIKNKPIIPVVDRIYNAESENAQSGKAVAEAIDAINIKNGIGVGSVQQGYQNKAYSDNSCAKGNGSQAGGRNISITNAYYFEGDGTAVREPEVRFSTPGTSTVDKSIFCVYKPITAYKIFIDYNITNNGNQLAIDSTTKYSLRIIGAHEGTGSDTQFYYHIPEIIDDGNWRTLMIDLNSTFTGGSEEGLPMNVTSFDDINDIICCVHFNFGTDFNGKIMFGPVYAEYEGKLIEIPLESGKTKNFISSGIEEVNIEIGGGGENASAEGSNTMATGFSSHSQGIFTVANGEASHAGGFSTIANYSYQTVIGKYNNNKENSLFEVGNGNSKNELSNAFEVLEDGRAKIYGTPMENNDLVTVRFLKDVTDKENITYATFNIVTENTTITLQNLENMSEIDWGDGTVNNELSHIYQNIGIYICKIYDITGIGECAFTSIWRLQNIVISNNVKSIGSSVFSNCVNLTDIIFNNPNPVNDPEYPWFLMCDALTNIYVPYGCSQNYKNKWAGGPNDFILDLIVESDRVAMMSDLNSGLDTKLNKSGGLIGGDLSVQGNLTVSGETTTLDTVTLQVKDNIIVANADGAELVENAGFAMKTSATAAYGIMYDPVGDGVKIGLGSFDENGKFKYTEGEDQFLATRADTIVNGHTVVWDDDTKQLVDSGVAHSEYVKFTDYITSTKAGLLDPQGFSKFVHSGLIIDEENHILRVRPCTEGMIMGRADYYNQPLTLKMLDNGVKAVLTDPKVELSEDSTDESGNAVEGEKTKACKWLGALKKNTDTFVSASPTDVSVYCVDQNGNQVMQKAYGGVIRDTIVRRLGDNIQVPEHNTSWFAINKGQADKSYVAKDTSATEDTTIGARVYGIDKDGNQVILEAKSGTQQNTVIANTVAMRDHDGNIRVGLLPYAGWNAVCKSYVEDYMPSYARERTDKEKTEWCDWIGAVKKDTANDGKIFCYGRFLGSDYLFNVAEGATASTLCFRGAGGVVGVGTPKEAHHATPKSWVEEYAVAKVTTKDIVYGVDSNGNQKEYPCFATERDPYTIGMRDSTGNFRIAETPTQSYHTASKGYVDDKIAELQAQIDALKGQS